MSKDAAVIKALAELGLHKKPQSKSQQIRALERRLNQYEKEFGKDLDPRTLSQYTSNLTENHATMSVQSIHYHLKKLANLDPGDYSINEDLSVNIHKNVVFRCVESVRSLPMKINVADGNFQAYGTSLDTLKNFPEIVGGDFVVSKTWILSYEGAPKIVKGNVNCSDCPNIQSLDGLPSNIGESLFLENLPITTFKGIHKHVKRIGRNLHITNTYIKSHMLGLLMIKGLKGIVDYSTLSGRIPAEDYEKYKAALYIMNKHLESGRDVHACQEELLEAGLPEYAKL